MKSLVGLESDLGGEKKWPNLVENGRKYGQHVFFWPGKSLHGLKSDLGEKKKFGQIWWKMAENVDPFSH